MDKIVIESLCIDTVIGVYEWEQSVRQTLILDLELSCDACKAASTDQLADALDYAGIANRIEVYASVSQFLLMETLAEHIARLLLEEFSIQHVKLYLRKSGALSRAASAGVRIERSRQQ